jgi:glycerol-1-phosphate dehydrogenase [NAD(P)+]
MDKILGLKIEEMADKSFLCGCGKEHSVGIKKIYIGENAKNALLEAVIPFKDGKILLISDDNIYKIYGKEILELLQNNFKVSPFVFKSSRPLVPDEKALGRLLVEITNDVSLIITAGSGTLNDLSRFLSFKLKIPYIIVCSAPSMDGYASVVSPLIIEGFKNTFEAVYPYAIIADEKVIKDAPMDMLRAGFGDIIGKFTALADWRLSKIINNEYYCETTARLIGNALENCVRNAEGIGRREEGAAGDLLNALILSGVAMGLVGNSRPASGSEHHLAHYWEMDALAQGKEHPLHGNAVGVGAVVISTLYHLIDDKIISGLNVPEPLFLKNLLNLTGSINNPADLGIDKKLFRNSILHAMEIRPRYTIFHFLSKDGKLEAFADKLTKEFYD